MAAGSVRAITAGLAAFAADRSLTPGLITNPDILEGIAIPPDAAVGLLASLVKFPPRVAECLDICNCRHTVSKVRQICTSANGKALWTVYKPCQDIFRLTSRHIR